MIIVGDLRFKIGFVKRIRNAPNQEIDVALPEIAIVRGVHHGLRNVDADAGLLARETLEHCGQETGRDAFGAGDLQLSDSWIGKEGKLFNPELEFVEDGLAA